MEYGLIGEHLSHSFSKLIHESIESYTYDLKELKKDELVSFLTERNFNAVNVTIPYKEAVISFLDEMDDAAKEIGAVNIIVNRNGKLIGYNSDVDGFIYLVNKSGIDVKNKNVLILGTGGAYKAIRYALNKLGAKSILVASRTKCAKYLSYSDIDKHQEIEVVVNATPVGMYPHNEFGFDIFDSLKALEGYIDIIYNPINTKNVVEASNKNIKSIGGLYMLIYQAIKSIEIFLNKKIDDSVVDRIYKKILNERSNIVLIGMPSSGKSRIGRLLSEELGIKFIDTDKVIENRIGTSIANYFDKYGEKEFRKLETEVIEEIYKETPMVISTGGGVIKNSENMKMLKQNGRIVFINCPLDKLRPSNDRPLSSNIDDLTNLYETRLPLYRKYKDIEVMNYKNDPHDVVKEILKL